MALVRVYEPTDPADLARVRMLLDASGVPFFVEGENYFATAGGLVSLGDTRLFIQVDETWLQRAQAALSGSDG